MLLVPMDSPGLKIIRMTSVFGYDDAPQGHAQIRFDNVHIPVENLIGADGQGFEIAQGRMGSGRIHQCMRSIGAAERALELLVHRSMNRHAFGKPLSELGGNVDVIANSRIEIEMSRLMALKAAWSLEQKGLVNALGDIAQIKVVVTQHGSERHRQGHTDAWRYGGFRGHATGQDVGSASRHAIIRRAR